MRYEEFYSFLVKREQLRLNKQNGMPFPWTADPILREYKFTNVRREHDRTTMEFIQRFYSQQGQCSITPVILLNCATFRYFGTWEFAAALGWQEELLPATIMNLAKDRLAQRERVFTGAYIITNQGIKAPKEQVVVEEFLTPLWNAATQITEVMKTYKTWKRTHEALAKIQGFGGSGFMAKETLLDTMHCKFWPNGKPDDYDCWTPIGPGGRRGVNRVRGAMPDQPLTFDATLDILLKIWNEQDKYWPKEWGQLAPTDIQFQLCEFDKYERTRLGEGRPRSRYKPRGTNAA